MGMNSPTAASKLEQQIFIVRGQKVMLSMDLAVLYRVEPKVLTQAMTRNIERFPADFMFRLSVEEARSLRSQIVTLKRGQHIKYAPYAFTEQGVAMLSSVLHSHHAIQVNIAIMRAFVRLREAVALHKELAIELKRLEQKVSGHDAHIRRIFGIIRELTEAPSSEGRRIGFQGGT